MNIKYFINFIPLAILAVFGCTTVAIPSDISWEDAIEVASGDAFRGPWRMNDSQFHFVDDPTVSITDDGIIAVAWADLENRDIVLQIYESDGTRRFSEPVNISKSPDVFSWLPIIVISGDNASNISILWQEIVFSGGSHGGEIFFARSSDGGSSFRDPVNLSNTIAGAGKGRLTTHRWDNGSLDLVEDNNGGLYAAWTEYEGALLFSRSDDSNGTFSKPIHIAGGNGELPTRGPSIDVGADGSVYMAWSVGEDESSDIYFTYSNNNGRTFEKPQVVYNTDGHSDAPQIAIDSKRSIHIVFGESPHGMFSSYDVLYTSRNADDEYFDSPRVISGNGVNDISGANYPEISTDSAGNLYVMWEIFPRDARRSRGLGLTVSDDGGRTFSPAAVVPGSMDPDGGFNGSQQGLLMRKMAVNGSGLIAIVNSTFRQNEVSHIRLINGQSNLIHR